WRKRRAEFAASGVRAAHLPGSPGGLSANVPGPGSASPPVFQALGAITAVPVTGPQVSSLQRLAGQGAAVLPQVRPKTLIPDSLPVTPGRDRPPKQPPTFQKATVVSIKNPSPALPTANNTVSHVPAPGSQPQALAEPAAIASPLSSAGVAYAIISTAPSNAAIAPSTAVSVVSDSVKVQPLLISADKKVIIIQPQVQTQPESTGELRPPTEEPSQGAQATKKKKEDWPPSQENPEKIAFMVALGLVTTEHLEEIQSKRQERKRRSTANPAYSGLLETERKRLASNYLNTPLFLTARGKRHGAVASAARAAPGPGAGSAWVALCSRPACGWPGPATVGRSCSLGDGASQPPRPPLPRHLLWGGCSVWQVSEPGLRAGTATRGLNVTARCHLPSISVLPIGRCNPRTALTQ
uniref:PHD finger protein 21B n=1 Tax=Canis lupus dingo TaxID=286419 RepID=A0A8C0K9X0_CANLU